MKKIIGYIGISVMVLVAIALIVLFAPQMAVHGQGVGVNTAVVSTPAPTGVNSVYVGSTGVTQQTSYCYWVVAVYNVGMASPISSACTTQANATLTSSNYNTITWSSPGPSVTGYWVVRSTGSTFPGTGTIAVNSSVLSATTFSQTDQSNTLNAFTFSPAGYAYYSIGVNNKDFGLPVMQIQNQNGVVQYQWIMNGNIHHKTESVEGNVTVAALHATPVIVVPVLGETLRITGILFQAVGGSTATCTSISVKDTAAVVGATVTATALTSGTVVDEATASGVTLTTFLTNLTASMGMELTDSGSQCTGATSFNYRIFYKVLP